MPSKPVSISSEHKNFIIDKAVEGFEPDEITYMLENEEEAYYTVDTVNNYLESDEAQGKIDVRERIREKKSQVTKEELITDLNDVKESLKKRSEKLMEEDLDAINNDTVKALQDSISLIGEFIGELKQNEDSNAGVVNVANLEQNFDLTKTVQFLPSEDKKSVAEELADDPEVEDFVIKKKS